MIYEGKDAYKACCTCHEDPSLGFRRPVPDRSRKRSEVAAQLHVFQSDHDLRSRSEEGMDKAWATITSAMGIPSILIHWSNWHHARVFDVDFSFAVAGQAEKKGPVSWETVIDHTLPAVL